MFKYETKQIASRIAAMLKVALKSVVDTSNRLFALTVAEGSDTTLTPTDLRDIASAVHAVDGALPELVDGLRPMVEAAAARAGVSAEATADQQDATSTLFDNAAEVAWVHNGPNLDLVIGTEVLYSISVDEAFPFGPETIERLEMMRSTPYFLAEVVLHFVSFLAEHDMELQEYLDEQSFAAQDAGVAQAA